MTLFPCKEIVDHSRNVEASRQEYLLQNKTYEYDGFNKATKVTAEYYGTAAESTSAYHTATVEDFSYAAEQNSSIKVRVQENFYDAEHLRYGIVEDGERTNFVTNGWNVLSESDAEFDVTKRLVLGYGIVSSNTLSDGEEDYQFFHWNEHGDTEYITGDDGNVLNCYEYDAFGLLTTAEEIIRNRYTYNGEQYDNITSQYYLRARFYNPLIARFTQEDVYRGDGLNLYAYCANNAVMYVDPSGYKCEKGTEETEPGINDNDTKITQAREAQQRAASLAEQQGYNNSPPNRKTVASDGDIYTLSGWKNLGEDSDFTRVSPQEVINKSQEIGHNLRSAGANDQGVPGQYNASHAEKQLSIISDKPIGISQPMCTDCQSYFSQLSVAENRTIYTAEPNTVRIFNSDASVSSIRSDGSVSVSIQKNKIKGASHD